MEIFERYVMVNCVCPKYRKPVSQHRYRDVKLSVSCGSARGLKTVSFSCLFYFVISYVFVIMGFLEDFGS